MTTTTTIILITIPESENPTEARPSFVARAKLDAALYLATTAHKQTQIIRPSEPTVEPKVKVAFVT